MRSISVKIGLAVLLVLSLGLKAQSRDVPVVPPMEQPKVTALVSMLTEAGFSVTQKAGFESPTLVADKPECRIEIATVTPLGWHQSALASLAENQRLVFVYAGQTYDQQPALRTKADYYWHKLKSYFHVNDALPPVFAVMASPNCVGPMDDAGVAQLLL